VSKTAPVASVDGALSKLSGLFIFGLLLAAVGTWVLVAQWPSEAVTGFTPECMASLAADCAPEVIEPASGSKFLAVIGALLLVLANAMVLVSTVGWGVKLGNQATLPRP
jgi:hypothetical protein